MRRARGSPGVPKPRKGSARKALDWVEGRRLFEVEGLLVAEIARRLGCKHHTVAARRDAEGWNRQAIGNRAADVAVQALADQIVAETGPAIVETVRETERQKRLALAINGRILERLARKFAPDLVPAAALPAGDVEIDEPPSLVLRRCGFLNLGRGDGEGSADGASDEDSAADEAAVAAALEEVAGD